MASEVGFRSTRGGDPVERILKIRKAIKPTEGDLLYAGQRQRTRILDRTARGVDVDEHPFKPYSEKGPFYYYPNGRVGNSRFTDKQLKDAARRLFRKLTPGLTRKERAKGVEGIRLTRTGRGLVFDSYAAFKKWLGRAGVDLRGPRSPHMLQGIAVKTGNRQFAIFGDQAVGGPDDMPNPADELVIGIYGEAAARATGHNKGKENDANATVPQRRFFGASASDAKQMIRDIYQRMRLRLTRG
ncbi:MAG: hypothetical protein ACK5AZ_07990 [Bryobacteraceae bacterium]